MPNPTNGQYVTVSGFPANLLRRVEKQAKDARRSRSAMVVVLVGEALEARRARQFSSQPA